MEREVLKGEERRIMKKISKTEMKLQDIKTLGNYSEKEKEWRLNSNLMINLLKRGRVIQW